MNKATSSSLIHLHSPPVHLKLDHLSPASFQPHTQTPSVSHPLSLTASPLTPSFPCSLEVMSAILKLSLLLSMWLHKEDTVMLWGEEKTNTHKPFNNYCIYAPAFAMCIFNTRNLSPEAITWETVLSMANCYFNNTNINRNFIKCLLPSALLQVCITSNNAK